MLLDVQAPVKLSNVKMNAGYYIEVKKLKIENKSKFATQYMKALRCASRSVPLNSYQALPALLPWHVAAFVMENTQLLASF